MFAALRKQLNRVGNRFYRFLHCEQVGECLRIPTSYQDALLEYRATGDKPRYDVSRPAVFFDMRDNRFHRYLYSLVQMFDCAGFQVLVRHRVRFIGRLSLYSRMILRMKNVLLVGQVSPEVKIRFYQSRSQAEKEGGIYLSDDYFVEDDHQSYHVPMCMHPDVYNSPLVQRRPGGREVRNIRLLFAGSVDPARYSNPVIGKVFRKMRRLDVVDTVLQCFRDEVVVPHAQADVASGRTVALLMVVDPRVTLDTGEFMETLGRSDFYLATPGVVMPLCHNVVEGMSMGAVPLLQYPELFYPPLEDNVNCVVFRDREDLIRRVAEILGMPPLRIAALRRNASAYYKEHLSPDSIMRTIQDHAGELRVVRLLSEQGSVEHLRRRIKRRGRGNPSGSTQGKRGDPG